MTPLARWLARHLPRHTVPPALVLIYAATLLAVWLLIGEDAGPMPYLDLSGGP